MQSGKVLLRGLNVTPDTRILDVGCGVGGFTTWAAAEFGCRVTGITIVPLHLTLAWQIASKRGASELCDFMLMDMSSLTFPDNGFDVMVNQETMCYAVDKAKYLAEVHRILKPGGTWRSIDLVLLALGTEFLAVGVLVYLLATDRPSATRFLAFAGIGAATLAVAPASSTQHPWAQYLEWLTNDAGAAAMALFFLSAPVSRWRWLQRFIIWSFPPLLALYSYAVLIDPSVYDLVKPLSFAYLAICIIGTAKALMWPFVTHASKEQRQLWPVAICIGIVAAVFAGGSLLPFMFFHHCWISPTVAIMSSSLLPVSMMWPLLRHRFMGVRLDAWSLSRTILETSTDSVFVIGRNGRPVYISKTGREMIGTAYDDRVNTSFGQIAERWEVRGDETAALTGTLLQRVLDGETFRDEEKLVHGPDGSVLCMSIAGTPVFDKRGQVDMAVLLYRDITGRKRMEEELRSSREELELRILERTAELSRANEEMQSEIVERKQAEELLETTRSRLEHILAVCPAFIYSLNVEPGAQSEHSVAFVSRNIKDMFGYEIAECLADPDWWVDHIHPADRPLALLGRHALFEHDRSDCEYRFRHKDGIYRWLHDTRRLLRDAEGEPAEIIGSWVDVTEQRKAEERIQCEAARTKALLGIASRLSTELGLDVNGWVKMTGGTVIVNGPIVNFSGALDYDREFTIAGGTLVAVGSTGMAQAPDATSTQYSLAPNLASPQPAGTLVHIEAENGTGILTFAPIREYQSVVYSSPELKKGSTYNVYVGGSSTGSVVDGVYSGGSYTPGTRSASLTISNIVTN